jgi:hypothetical protein
VLGLQKKLQKMKLDVANKWPLTFGSSAMDTTDGPGKVTAFHVVPPSALFRKAVPISQTMFEFFASTASWGIAIGGESTRVQLLPPFTVLKTTPDEAPFG